MKKQATQLALLLLVFAALVVGMMEIRSYKELQSEKELAEGETTIAVNDVEAEEITHITYTYEEETYSLKKEGETWFLEDDQSINIDQDTIQTMVSYLSPIEAKQEIENVSDFEQYGLKSPSRVFTYSTSDGEECTIWVGDRNPIQNDYYIMPEGDSSVYLINSAFVTAFSYSLESLTSDESN